MTAQELFEAVEADPMERLKWRVLSRFGVLPASAQAEELSDEDYLICGAHMVLDNRMVSDRFGGNEVSYNSSFDESCFLGLLGDGDE